MAILLRVIAFMVALFGLFYEVASFWLSRFYRSVWRKGKTQELLDTLHNAQSFEQWDAAAEQLDQVILENYNWRNSPPSKDYNSRLILNRTILMKQALIQMDVHAIAHELRAGLVRNLGNITLPKLYNSAYAGTKNAIEAYVDLVVEAVQFVSIYPTHQPESMMRHQQQLDLLHDSRVAYGRSCLVLQGGSIFGLCHIGVVKALHLRGLLPRIIAGTATGALMAALVGVHTEGELLGFLSGEGIDLSAFAAASERAAEAAHFNDGHARNGWLSTLWRRAKRFMRYGYVLDINVLEDCVRANVGDLTFEEAYHRTKRVLNITVSATRGGVPGLLNYLTAPNVLIWSAAMASNAPDARFSPVTLQSKAPDGSIVPWELSAQGSMMPANRRRYNRTPSTDHDRNTPLSRVSELFNVNHFIVSQARPYIAPFLAPSSNHSNSSRSSKVPLETWIMKFVIMEVHHILSQMDRVGFLPAGVKRLLLDENVPGASWILVPQVGPSDFARLLRNPTPAEIDYWILRGERSVWPALCALKIRCAIEFALDQGYQRIRRPQPFDVITPVGEQELYDSNVGERRRISRMRSSSLGAA